MCKFCDNRDYVQYKVECRSTYADDNVCELISSDAFGSVVCENCHGCGDNNHMFTLSMSCRGISLGYVHRIRDLSILPFSEGIRINFCPWCGEQLEDNIIPIEKTSWISQIDDK